MLGKNWKKNLMYFLDRSTLYYNIKHKYGKREIHKRGRKIFD